MSKIIELTEDQRNNLKLWEEHEETDSKYIKDYAEGVTELTAINPMYQIKRGTIEWGSFGVKWGVKDSSFKSIEIGRSSTVKTETILLICEYTAILYYPNGEIPIESSKQITFSNNSVDVHYSKKCATDALSKGLSKLGFSADIYMQQYDIDKEPVKESNNKLKSYNKDKVLDSIEDEEITDISDSNKDEIKVIPVLSDLDKEFIKVMKIEKISKKRRDELIISVPDVVKGAYIKDPKKINL